MQAVQAPPIFIDTRFLSRNYSYAMIDAVVGFANSNESIADDAFFTFFSHDLKDSPDIFSVGVHVNTLGITNNTTPFDEAKVLPAFLNVTVVEDIAMAAAQSKVASGAWLVIINPRSESRLTDSKTGVMVRH